MSKIPNGRSPLAVWYNNNNKRKKKPLNSL